MTVDHLLSANVILNDGSTATFAPVDAAALAAYQQRDGREGEIYRALSALVADPLNHQTIVDGTPRHWRRCGGYNLDRFIHDPALNFNWPADPRFNLARLVSGAEGTLAVITELKLNLVPLPTMTALAIVHFDDLVDRALGRTDHARNRPFGRRTAGLPRPDPLPRSTRIRPPAADLHRRRAELRAHHRVLRRKRGRAARQGGPPGTPPGPATWPGPRA